VTDEATFVSKLNKIISRISMFAFRVRWKWLTTVRFVDVGPCKDSFAVIKGQVATYASSIPPCRNVKSFEDCRAQCLSDNNCGGFSWKSNCNTEMCQLYYLGVYNTKSAASCDIHVRERCLSFRGCTTGRPRYAVSYDEHRLGSHKLSRSRWDWYSDCCTIPLRGTLCQNMCFHKFRANIVWTIRFGGT